MMPSKKKPLPLARKQRETIEDPSKVNSNASVEQQLTFPLLAAATDKPFGQKLLDFAQSDSLPLAGPQAVQLLEQFGAIRKALDLVEARYRKALATNPDCLPGWGLAPGALVRETFRVPALAILDRLNKAGFELPSRLLLKASRINLGELVAALSERLDIEPKEAALRLNRVLDGFLPERRNRPALRRLNQEEANLQALRLQEGEEGGSSRE
jgi:hypothetical protein